MSMIWPIALVIFSNIIYQICAKGVPKNMDVMASMTITYLVGAVCSAIMYFVMNKNGNLLQEYMKTNWAPIFLGISVVGLEVGFIYAYKKIFIPMPRLRQKMHRPPPFRGRSPYRTDCPWQHSAHPADDRTYGQHPHSARGFLRG